MNCYCVVGIVTVFYLQSQALSVSFIITCHLVQLKQLVVDRMLMTYGANFIKCKIGCVKNYFINQL